MGSLFVRASNLTSIAVVAFVLTACSGGSSSSMPSSTPPVPPPTYSIGGTISGLSGSGLVLQNNGANDLAVSESGVANFVTAAASGTAYNITVKTQPTNPSQTCSVANGAGTLSSSNVTIVVTCTTNTFTVGGSVNGLSGTGLVLQNGGGNDLVVTASGIVTFTTAVPSGANYNVTVKTQPSYPAQNCSVTDGTGTIANANITNVTIACLSLPVAAITAAADVHSATLSWTNPSGATSFNVYVSSARNCDIKNYSSCPDGALITGATSPRTISSLQNGKAYFF